MCAWVSTTRRTGCPNSATAAANGSHCDRTISVSMTVNQSSSATTPALLIPEPPPGCSQAQTPSLSFSSATPRPYPSSCERLPVRRTKPLEAIFQVGVGRPEVEPVDGDHPPPGLLLDPVESFVVGDPEPGAVVLVAVVLQQH